MNRSNPSSVQLINAGPSVSFLLLLLVYQQIGKLPAASTESKFMPDLRFYTTSECHLCDQGWALLKPIAERKGLSVQHIDVMDDAIAEKQYAERIPVITQHQRSEVLSWPFTSEDIYRWLM